MTMDLRRLRHLLALDEERHFGRAAERAHLSQPAFSRSIQTLEDELGQRLFDRATGGIRPTPAGAFLIERARRLIADARGLTHDMALYGATQLGDAAFGAGPFPAATLLPEVLSALRRHHPGVNLRVEVNNWRLLLERLDAEDIEFFVAEVRNVTVDAGHEVRLLSRQAGGFYVRPGHPLAGRRCTLAEAWAFGVLTTRLPPQLLTALAALLGLPPGQPPPFALECDDVGLLRETAMTTDSVAALTHAAVQADVSAGRLSLLAIDGLPGLYAEMGIVTRRGRTLSPTARVAIDQIEAAASRVNAQPPA